MTRVNRIDLVGQSRAAVTRTLIGRHPLRLDLVRTTAARRGYLDDIVDELSEQISAGRFTKRGVRYRAEFIAREEITYGQRLSSVAGYAQEGIMTRLRDARLGADRSDPDCIARNGRVLSPQEALGAVESAITHPRCTLQILPQR